MYAELRAVFHGGKFRVSAVSMNQRERFPHTANLFCSGQEIAAMVAAIIIIIKNLSILYLLLVYLLIV
jgi:hypothetical protein